MTRKLVIAALVVLAAWSGSARAEAGFVPAANATDMVYDFRRHQIDIANGDEVVRYAVDSASLLPSVSLPGAALRGIDISRDGSMLALADATTDATHNWVHLVQLPALTTSKRSFDLDSGEGGIWSVAFAADGALLVTSMFNGSGWVPLRRLIPATGTWTALASVTQNTMLAASTDRNTIAFAEANISDGRWGLYDVPTGQMVRREWYTDGTSAFNYEIATDALGAQFVIPTYQGMYVYNDVYQKIWTVPPNDHAAVGVAFHPVLPLVYYACSGTRQVRVFNTRLGKLVAWYDMGDTFTWNGNGAYQSGRLKLSADGSLLMATTGGGVRYLRMYAPLTAANVSATVNSGVAANVALKGSIGNNGTLAYVIWNKPKHGTVTLTGATARYQSVAGYKGTDSFRYMVRYGAAAYVVATANVTVR